MLLTKILHKINYTMSSQLHVQHVLMMQLHVQQSVHKLFQKYMYKYQATS